MRGLFKLSILGICFCLFFVLGCKNDSGSFQDTSKSKKGSGTSNTVPTVSAINHSEANWDGSGNPLPTSVSCTVQDVDGLSTINTVRVEQNHTEAGNFANFYELFDDGTGNDAAAGDGIYTRTFVQNLTINFLWYTNKAGHFWECTATDDFLDKGVLKVITNP